MRAADSGEGTWSSAQEGQEREVSKNSVLRENLTSMTKGAGTHN